MRNRIPCQRDAGTRLATALRRRPFSECNKGNRRRLHAGKTTIESFYYFEDPVNATTSLLRPGFYGPTVVALTGLHVAVCMGCKRFFLKERKNVIFLNKINLPYCFVVFFVVCSRLRPFWSVFGELALFWCSTAKRSGTVEHQNTFFLTFKKNRLHPIQTFVNNRL